MPVTMRTSVLLPAPFSPSTAWIEPAATAKLTPLSARMPPKLLLTPSRARRGVMGRASRPLHRDADLGGGLSDAGERLLVERDAFLRIAALEPRLEEARRGGAGGAPPPPARPEPPGRP